MNPLPFVCLHGAYMDGTVFDDLGKELQRQAAKPINIFSPTLLGHGDDQTMDLSYPGQAAWLGQRYGSMRPILVGHSMGAGIALQCALDWETSPRALVLCGCGLRPAKGSNSTAGFLSRGIRPELSPEFIGVMVRGWFKEISPDRLNVYTDRALSLGTPRFDAIRASISEGIVENGSMLRELSMPVLVLHGRHDRNRSASEARQLAQTIGGAYVEFSHCAHAIPVEDPNGMAEALLNWVANETLF